MSEKNISVISVRDPETQEIEQYEIEVDADHVIFEDGQTLSEKNLDKDVPIDHSSEIPLYGAASYDKYGHVKIKEGNGLTIEDGELSLALASEESAGALDSETYGEIKDTIFSLIEDLEEINFRKGAPMNHAFESSKYGGATEDLYGHIKVQTGTGLEINDGELSLTEANNDTPGALTPELYGKLDSTYALLKNISDDLSNVPNMPPEAENKPELVFLIKEHATNKTTYGLGTDELYGHVKVKEENGLHINEGEISLTTADELNTGAIDKIDYSRLLDAYNYFKKHEEEHGFRNSTPIYHASVKDTYGVGSDELFGHVSTLR